MYRLDVGFVFVLVARQFGGFYNNIVTWSGERPIKYKISRENCMDPIDINTVARGRYVDIRILNIFKLLGFYFSYNYVLLFIKQLQILE